MRVLVCGGRKHNDAHWVHKVLDKLDTKVKITCIIEGGASGADRFAHIWAKCRSKQLETYPANWNKHGKSAGYIRNAQMLKEGKPDLVVGFEGGPGTAMMLELARKVGIKVLEY